PPPGGRSAPAAEETPRRFRPAFGARPRCVPGPSRGFRRMNRADPRGAAAAAPGRTAGRLARRSVWPDPKRIAARPATRPTHPPPPRSDRSSAAVKATVGAGAKALKRGCTPICCYRRLLEKHRHLALYCPAPRSPRFLDGREHRGKPVTGQTIL